MGNLDATVNLAYSFLKVSNYDNNLQSNKSASRALLAYAAKKGHVRAVEYMVDQGFLESFEINPNIFDSDDSQILETIDAVPMNIHNHPLRPASSNNFTAFSNKTEMNKPNHLISGSSGTNGYQ